MLLALSIRLAVLLLAAMIAIEEGRCGPGVAHLGCKHAMDSQWKLALQCNMHNTICSLSFKEL